MATPTSLLALFQTLRENEVIMVSRDGGEPEVGLVSGVRFQVQALVEGGRVEAGAWISDTELRHGVAPEECAVRFVEAALIEVRNRWPRCPGCGKAAGDGRTTCGHVRCR